ncbi:hypothetical protein [Nocardia flavorosea]|uniref:Uncharacterized protein n=1 Tax=Nocardia flavorosea TaxID=53429 RepID=A0A846YQM6_9NOCA|nr:hypothetical protein [Nocardia flavorosea]NKY59824.1 hypothetical protein [Nocardia flavorosea]
MTVGTTDTTDDIETTDGSTEDESTATTDTTSDDGVTDAETTSDETATEDQTATEDDEKGLEATSGDTGLGDAVGSEGRYWTVELVEPPGGSPGLLSYISMSEAAIQTAVDLLGRGMPQPPPKVDDLLTTVTQETLGKGEAEESYQTTLTAVQARQTSLLAMDNQVIDTSIVMAAEQDQTLRSIIGVVEHVNSVLASVGSADLKPAQEAKLMDLVGTAVEVVSAKVTAVSDLSSQMAGDSGEQGSGSGGSQTGGGNGNGAAPAAGGLGSIMPMLAMLPMALMPLAQMLPELLNPEEKDKEDEEGQAEEETPPGEPAPAPTDPTAPPGATTAPADQPGAPAPTPPPEGTAPQGRPESQV